MSEEYIKLKLYSKFDKMATSKGDENLSTKSTESTVTEDNLDALDVSFNRATVLYLTTYQIHISRIFEKIFLLFGKTSNSDVKFCQNGVLKRFLTNQFSARNQMNRRSLRTTLMC